VGSRNEFSEMVADMKQRFRTAAENLQAAALQQPQIQSLTQNALSQINTKYTLLEKTETLLLSAMEEEVEMREDIIELAEEVLKEEDLSQAEQDQLERKFSRIKGKLFDEDNLVNIDAALRSLRESMNVRLQLDSILRAAENNT